MLQSAKKIKKGPVARVNFDDLCRVLEESEDKKVVKKLSSSKKIKKGPVIIDDKPRYTKTDLDEKFKKIEKKDRKMRREMRKKKLEYEKFLKSKKIEIDKMNIKRRSIIDKYSHLDHTIEDVCDSIRGLPVELKDIVWNFLLRLKPRNFFLSKSTYAYLKKLSSDFFQEDVKIDLPGKYREYFDIIRCSLSSIKNTPPEGIIIKNEIVFKKALGVINLLKLMDPTYINQSRILNMLDSFSVDYDLKKTSSKFKTEEERKDSRKILFQQVFILDLLLREFLGILSLTLPFHKAAMDTTNPIVKLSSEKTMKWYLEQNVVFDKNNNDRHSIKRMVVVLDKTGGLFMSENDYKWMNRLILSCFSLIMVSVYEQGPKKIDTIVKFI
jgi:hypothetical protein